MRMDDQRESDNLEDRRGSGMGGGGLRLGGGRLGRGTIAIALVASYFDILFAFNRMSHPGEKRLIEQAARLCPRLPRNMAAQMESVLLIRRTQSNDR